MDFSLLVCLYSSVLEDVLSRDLVRFLDFIDEVAVKRMSFRASTVASSNFTLQNNQKYTFSYFNSPPF